MTQVHIAIAQFESTTSVAENRAKLVDLVEAAGREGADMVMFHEIATTHYFCYDDDRPDYLDLAEPVPGPSSDAITDVAKRTGTSVLLPMYEASESARYNSVVYIDAEKGMVGKYRKSHVPVTGSDGNQKGANEGYYFAAGDTGFVPVDVAGVSVGSTICYDRHFPEAGREYALKGAHLIFAPTASYRDFIIDEIWKAELQAMAFQNSVYVAGVNKIGRVIGEDVPANAHYPGMSMVIDPRGQVITECGDGEEIAMATVDTEFCGRIRGGAMRLISARRPELYGSLVAKGSQG